VLYITYKENTFRTAEEPGTGRKGEFMLEKMKELRKENKKGFTLIELIVVIAILAILMALAVPQYNGLRKKAAKQVADANARTAYTACEAIIASQTGTAELPSAADIVEMLTGTTGTTFAGGTVAVTGKDAASVGITWTPNPNPYDVTGKYPAD